MFKSISSFFVISFLTILPLALHQSASAQEQAQQASTDVERIDQMLKECGELIRKGQFDDLLKKAEEALSLSQKVNDKSRQARALNYIGTVRYHRKQFEDAAEAWKQAASLFGEANDRARQVNALVYANVAFKDSGRYEDALDALNRAALICREIGDKKNEAQIFMHTGRIYASLGEHDRAESSLHIALRLARESKQPGLEFTVLADLGDVESDRRNYDAALRYFEQALALDSPAINQVTREQLLESQASLYSRMGEHRKALELLQRILDSATSTKGQSTEWFVRSRIGWELHRMGRSQEGLESLGQARALLRRMGYSPADEIDLDLFIGHIQKDLKHYEDALASYRKALVTVDRLRAGVVPTEMLKASFADKYRDPYIETVDVLFALKREAEALEIAEAYHGRAFLDMLAESRIDPRRDLPIQERDREEKLFNRIYAIQKELWNEDLPREREDQLKRDLTSAEDALEAFQLELRRTTPRYANVQYPDLLKLDRIQRDLIENDSAVIEYMLGDERSFAWAITHSSVTAVALPPRKEIEHHITSYRQMLKERVLPMTIERALERLDAQSRLLYQILIRPIESALVPVNKLIIIPDGPLGYLPFETLLIDKKLSAGDNSAQPQILLERFAVSYAPSASSLAAIKDRKKNALPKNGLIAFGDPVYDEDKNDGERSAAPKAEASLPNIYAERGLDLNRLPYTRAEVNSIGSLFPAAQRRIYLGEQAREQMVKSAALDQYRYVHFAAHGLIDEQRPARSGIVLSLEKDSKEDGVLQMSEIMRLRLNAELVTLSACRTGLGKLLNGEGVIGLTRAFFYAGADSVVVSLWNVNDSATSELMKAFYQNLNRGLPKDEALRQAKLSLIKSRQRTWRHPYFWAPFVLVGERR
jgi:CHAT domain-containing protein